MADSDSFSKAKDMIFPRDILVGHDILPRIAQMCSDFSFRNVGMIITGCQTYRSAGKFIEECMIDNGFEMSVHHTGNASITNVEKAVDEARERRSKFLLAVGGGSKIDITKLAAKELKIPFVSIPTSAA
ncbi:MAG: iron-containing alcohol dehydrogenase, partial [archaeon]|nr:iron-containing alcohol dehydrogenase [archaeon]